TAIIDYVTLTESLGRDLEAAGGEIRYNTEVARLDTLSSEVRVMLALPGAQGSKITEPAGTFDLAITCAGLQADRLAVASGLEEDPRIVPFYGDYFVASGPAAQVVKGLIYPVPDPAYPFLGVHLTQIGRASCRGTSPRPEGPGSGARTTSTGKSSGYVSV